MRFATVYLWVFNPRLTDQLWFEEFLKCSLPVSVHFPESNDSTPPENAMTIERVGQEVLAGFHPLIPLKRMGLHIGFLKRHE